MSDALSPPGSANSAFAQVGAHIPIISAAPEAVASLGCGRAGAARACKAHRRLIGGGDHEHPGFSRMNLGGVAVRFLQGGIAGADALRWNRALSKAANVCLFHGLDFLAYHPAGRFDFAHQIAEVEGEPVALLPGGLKAESDRRIFRSPLGASFGGPALAAKARGSQLV
jgi:hypothetical protein